MKRKLLIAALIVLVLSVSVAGTLAYYTQQETSHNVITTGSIQIELIEKAIKDGKEVDFKDVEGVIPGEDVSKIAKVKNTGANDAFIRMSAKKSIELAKDVTGTPDLSLITIDFNETDWTDGGDGYWYYNTPLEAGGTTRPLFTTVKFDPQMDNLYENCKVMVDVAAQAVQTANNGTDPLAAAGWPA